jgi:hypothetical protein
MRSLGSSVLGGYMMSCSTAGLVFPVEEGCPMMRAWGRQDGNAI